MCSFDPYEICFYIRLILKRFYHCLNVNMCFSARLCEYIRSRVFTFSPRLANVEARSVAVHKRHRSGEVVSAAGENSKIY